jgi:hypothetical protein
MDTHQTFLLTLFWNFFNNLFEVLHKDITITFKAFLIEIYDHKTF